jgi:hypothetical protein
MKSFHSESTIQSGSSIHSPTPRSRRKALSTHTISVSVRVTAQLASSSRANGIRTPARLKMPPRPRSAERTSHAAGSSCVDELDEAARRTRCQYYTAARDSVWPVAEAARRIVRSHEQTAARDQASVPEDIEHDVLRLRLQRPVASGVALRVLLHGCERVVLAQWTVREIGVDVPGRDEGVVPGVSEQLRRGADHTRQESAGVDDGVEAAAGERGKAAVPVAFRPSEDEQLHSSCSSTLSSRSTSSAVL